MNLFIHKLLSLYLCYLLSVIVDLANQRMLATNRDTNAKNIERLRVCIAEQTFLVLSKYTRAFDTVSTLLMERWKSFEAAWILSLLFDKISLLPFYKKSLERHCSNFQTHSKFKGCIFNDSIHYIITKTIC